MVVPGAPPGRAPAPLANPVAGPFVENQSCRSIGRGRALGAPSAPGGAPGAPPAPRVGVRGRARFAPGVPVALGAPEPLKPPDGYGAPGARDGAPTFGWPELPPGIDGRPGVTGEAPGRAGFDGGTMLGIAGRDPGVPDGGMPGRDGAPTPGIDGAAGRALGGKTLGVEGRAAGGATLGALGRATGGAMLGADGRAAGGATLGMEGRADGGATLGPDGRPPGANAGAAGRPSEAPPPAEPPPNPLGPRMPPPAEPPLNPLGPRMPPPAEPPLNPPAPRMPPPPIPPPPERPWASCSPSCTALSARGGASTCTGLSARDGLSARGRAAVGAGASIRAGDAAQSGPEGVDVAGRSAKAGIIALVASVAMSVRRAEPKTLRAVTDIEGTPRSKPPRLIDPACVHSAREPSMEVACAAVGR